MPTKEFTVDTTANNGDLGSLIITDAQLLLRPAPAGQYHKIPYDVAHAMSILNLNEDEGAWVRHIVCHESPQEAVRLLDSVFSAYLDACCMELWCDALVNFIQDDTTVEVKHYGFDDGSYTMIFNVYCGISPSETDELVNDLITDLPDDGEYRSYVVIESDASGQGFVANGFLERLYVGELDGVPYDA